VITAVDTNVLLDVFGADPKFSPASAEALRRCLREGHLGLHVEELHDHCAIEKVGSRGTQVGNRIEHHGTGSIEDRFVMITVKFPATETAAGS
jgi:hypothetical protein